jgi:hypothetical protein
MPKKGYFCPQKQAYPPWLKGPFSLISCTSCIKRGLFWTNLRQKRDVLSREYVMYVQGIYLCCVQAYSFIMPVLSLYRSIIIKDLYTITRHNALLQFYSSAWRGFFIYCNLISFRNLWKICHVFHFFSFFGSFLVFVKISQKYTKFTKNSEK